MSPPSPLSVAKRAVETALRGSDMAYTLLWPAVFMEVWLGPLLGFDRRHGTVRVPGDGSAPIGWISRDDVARVAVACVDRPQLWNTALTVVAETLSLAGAVRVFEEEGGQPLHAEYVPVGRLEAQRLAATTPLERSLADLMLRLALGLPLTPDVRLAELAGTFTTVREVARQVTGRTALA